MHEIRENQVECQTILIWIQTIRFMLLRVKWNASFFCEMIIGSPFHLKQRTHPNKADNHTPSFYVINLNVTEYFWTNTLWSSILENFWNSNTFHNYCQLKIRNLQHAERSVRIIVLQEYSKERMDRKKTVGTILISIKHSFSPIQ